MTVLQGLNLSPKVLIYLVVTRHSSGAVAWYSINGCWFWLSCEMGSCNCQLIKKESAERADLQISQGRQALAHQLRPQGLGTFFRGTPRRAYACARVRAALASPLRSLPARRPRGISGPSPVPAANCNSLAASPASSSLSRLGHLWQLACATEDLIETGWLLMPERAENVGTKNRRSDGQDWHRIGFALVTDLSSKAAVAVSSIRWICIENSKMARLPTVRACRVHANLPCLSTVPKSTK